MCFNAPIDKIFCVECERIFSNNYNKETCDRCGSQYIAIIKKPQPKIELTPEQQQYLCL